jgi:two-component system, chemotaxis family, chemotaxis protein CheY
MFDPKARFLVIDDFKTMRTLVKRSLAQMGYTEVDEAEDGAIGHALLTKSIVDGKPYACVISDWNMPNMTGLELLVKVRSHALLKSLPFVLVTAENEQSQVIEAAKAGVSNYITKPFSAADFQTKMQLVYQKHNRVAKTA